MTEEHLGDRNGPTSVGNPDLGTYGEVLHRRLDQVFCPGRTVDIDWLSPLVILCIGHQRTKTRRMIIMVMREKNSSDVADVDPGFRQTARDSVAGVNNI